LEKKGKILSKKTKWLVGQKTAKRNDKLETKRKMAQINGKTRGKRHFSCASSQGVEKEGRSTPVPNHVIRETKESQEEIV